MDNTNQAQYDAWAIAPARAAGELGARIDTLETMARHLVAESARRGAPVTSIATTVGVSRETVYSWQRAMSEDAARMLVERLAAISPATAPREVLVFVDAMTASEPADEPFDPIMDADAEKVTGGLIDRRGLEES